MQSRLSFRASFASQAAGFAVADYSDDDKTRGDEGLDISKLNIHDDIVSCLSKKGITKLFPIQVNFFFVFNLLLLSVFYMLMKVVHIGFILYVIALLSI